MTGDIVLFPSNSMQGITASQKELIEETETSVEYRVTFDKPQLRYPADEPLPLEPEPQAATVASITPEPDTSPSPDLDYDEFPDLPDAS